MIGGNFREAAWRIAYMGLWVLAAVSLGGLVALEYPLAGVGAFVGFVVASFVVLWLYDGRLFDERDQRKQAAASKRTLRVLGVSSAVVFPTATALWALGVVEWPVWLTPIAFFVAALAFVHVGSMAFETARRA